MKEKAKAKEILQKIIPFLGIILMIIIFQVGGEGKLLTKGNINSILNQTVYIAIMAFGAIFVYSHGGMDLSYGGVIGFSVLVAILVANTGVPAGVVFITNILAALVWFVFERSCFRIFAGFAIYHITMHHVHVSWNLKYGMCITEI